MIFHGAKVNINMRNDLEVGPSTGCVLYVCLCEGVGHGLCSRTVSIWRDGGEGSKYMVWRTHRAVVCAIRANSCNPLSHV